LLSSVQLRKVLVVLESIDQELTLLNRRHDLPRMNAEWADEGC